MKKYLALFFLPILCQCSSNSAQTKAPAPTLHNRALEKSWGKPKLEQTSCGYRVVYTNPSDKRNKLTINTRSRMWASHQFPPYVKRQELVNGEMKVTSTPQVFRNATVMGKRTKSTAPWECSSPIPTARSATISSITKAMRKTSLSACRKLAGSPNRRANGAFCEEFRKRNGLVIEQAAETACVG